MTIEKNVDPSSLEIWTHDLTKYYGKGEHEVKAVDGIDISMEPEVHGFLGPNGAGKTSTINMLIGLISITKGEAKIKGLKAPSSEARRIIGFLPQEPALYSKMTGRQYLMHIARMSRIRKNEAKSKTMGLLERFDLTEAQNRKIETYSGGMKQKVAIAGALIGDPEILILDEPTSNLDPVQRDSIVKDIRALSERVSIFVSSHVLSEIEQMCNKITIINKGKIILTDTIENIKKIHSGGKNTYILNTSSNEEVLQDLKSNEFIEKVWINDDDQFIHIIPKDADKIEKEVPKIVIGKDLAMKKFSRKEFSLQDIFLDMMDNNKNSKGEEQNVDK